MFKIYQIWQIWWPDTKFLISKKKFITLEHPYDSDGDNKNAFQSKAHLPFADRKSST